VLFPTVTCPTGAAPCELFVAPALDAWKAVPSSAINISATAETYSLDLMVPQFIDAPEIIPE
jgi:hypothetical protein